MQVTDKFDCFEVEQWYNYFELHGYVVLENIMKPHMNERYANQMKATLTQIAPNLNFNDPSTWTIDNFPGFFAKGMIGLLEGIGQAEFFWKFRSHPILREVFKSYYTKSRNLSPEDSASLDLIPSMDAASLFFSKEQKTKSWPHTDFNPSRVTFEDMCDSIQGAYIFEGGSCGSGLMVVDGSHKSYTAVGNTDFIAVPAEDPHITDKSKHMVVGPGLGGNILILWKSNLIHWNRGPVSKSCGVIDRLAVYITMHPRKIAHDSKKRKQVVLDGATTSHWPDKNERKKQIFGNGTRYALKGFVHLPKPTVKDIEDWNIEHLL